MRYKKPLSILGTLLAVALAALYPQLQHPSPASKSVTTPLQRTLSVQEAQARHLSDVWVEGQGVVVKVLPDDTRGRRHQRFIVRLSNGKTVLIAHNIDLAPRLKGLRPGDTVTFRGEFVDNDKGGLVHWTHRDPSGRHEGGWIKYRGRLYR